MFSTSSSAKMIRQRYLGRSSSIKENLPVLVGTLKSIVACNEENISRFVFGSIKLHRTLSFFPNLFHYFTNVISQVEHLKKLDVSGNLAGPIAFKALLLSLIKHDAVEELDISKNKADADCGEFVRSYISSSCNLRKLNLSGNELGRESLARSLCVALQRTTSRSDYGNLVELNISNCGLVYMHSLFDGLRIGLSYETCCLTHLNVSENLVRDGQQLGNDICLVLEHQKCTLKFLCISNVGLDAIGFDSVIAGLRNNHSLTDLYAGGSLNHVKNVAKIKDALFASRCLCVLHLKGITVDEMVKYNLANRGIVGLFDYEVQLTQINLSECTITDEFLLQMIPKFAGKLATVRSLDLSYNEGISTLSGLKELLLSNGISALETLNLSGLKLKNLSSVLSYCEHLHTLVVEDSELQRDDFVSLCKLVHSLKKLDLSNIALAELNLITYICSIPFCHQLTHLSLKSCSLNNNNIQPLLNTICQDKSISLKLTGLDVSQNSINEGIFKIFDFLLHTSRYPLQDLNVSNNEITDKTARSISKFILFPSCKSQLQKLNISTNSLSNIGIKSLVKSMATKSRKTGLLHLDISNQKNVLCADEFEEIAELLIDIALDNNEFLWLKQDEHVDNTQVQSSFYVNLTKLQTTPSLKPCSKMLLLAASIFTDLSEKIKVFASLTDYLLFASGLDKCSSDPTSATDCGTTAAFTHEQWESVISRQAPYWLKIVNEQTKIIYFNSLPDNLTENIFKDTLENECCCSTKNIHLINDSVFDKFSNCAWIMCEDDHSYRNVFDWFIEGKAKMFGKYVSVCCLPVSVLNAEERIANAAKNESSERALQKKIEIDSNVTNIEHSNLIAEEAEICTEY